ncbi:hypothetical protein X777_00507, partial [Ooceraea biroi]
MKKRNTDWWEQIVQNHFNEEDWLESFRLCDQLKNELPPSVNQLGVREPISVQKQVAVCVYFLSSYCEYHVVGNVFGIHKSTVWKCVHKVVDIFMPKNDECQTIAALFERRTNIPQLIGAIDGSHIPILPPSDDNIEIILIVKDCLRWYCKQLLIIL